LNKIKTELKHKRYGENKIAGTYLQLTIDIRGSKQESRDTANSACEKVKEHG
jgi:hypothetical protein